MGKIVIVVGDRPGFYTSRVLGVMMNEALLLLGEGARIPDVDAALTAFGFPVGPFVLYDEVGLGVAQHAGETLLAAFADRFHASDIVHRMVAAGLTGRKAGAGFYLRPRPSRIRRALARVKPIGRLPNEAVYRLAGSPRHWQPGPQTIQDRLVLLFVNEAIRCLEEGVLQTPTDGDLGAVLGLGFPAFTGGPFHYADSYGLMVLERRLRELAHQHGSRYAPSGPLVERAAAGRRFFEE